MVQINNIEVRCQVTDYQIECIKKDVNNLSFPFCTEPVNVIVSETDIQFKNGLSVYVYNDEGYFGWDDSYEPVKLNYVAVDGCGFVNLGLTDEIANACYHSGSCDYDTEVYLDAPIIREQLDNITDEQIIKSLNECGIDEYNPSEHTRRDNESWLLFLAAANYKEEKAMGYFDNED